MSRVPLPVNDQNKTYLPHSPERAELKTRLAQMAAERIDIPLVIGGCEIRTGRTEQSVMPHDHRHVLADWHAAEPAHVNQAIEAALAARRDWGNWTLAGSRRSVSESGGAAHDDVARHAECRDDAGAVEDGDSGRDRFGVGADRFLAFQSSLRAGTLRGTADQQPRDVEQRGVPAARGFRVRGDAVQLHVDCRQPSHGARADGQHGDLEAGVERDAERALHSRSCSRPPACRPGVINLVAGNPAEISTIVLDSPDLAGIHFTGSTAVFNSMWKRVGENIGRYRSYPRLVGETGGKDFIVAHASADVQELAVAIVRGGFEYQGQKCSAASRIYVPQSLWPEVRDRAVAMMREIRMGDVADFRTFMGAVIDRKSFTKISGYLEDARKNAKVIQGGGATRRRGLLRRADADRDERPRLSAAVRGDLRAGGHGLRHTLIRSGARRSTSSIARHPMR